MSTHDGTVYGWFVSRGRAHLSLGVNLTVTAKSLHKLIFIIYCGFPRLPMALIYLLILEATIIY